MEGGGGNNGVLNDVWEFDGTNWVPRPAPTHPLGGSLGHLVYDEARGESLLLGVTTATAIRIGTVQAWDGVQWSVKPGFGVHPSMTLFASSSADHTGA